jgi:hypothetical protein
MSPTLNLGELASTPIADRDLYWHSTATRTLRELELVTEQRDEMERALKVIHTWANVPGALDALQVARLTARALGREAA